MKIVPLSTTASRLVDTTLHTVSHNMLGEARRW